MKAILKNWSAVAVAALGVGAFASATQAGSVVNLIQSGVTPVVNIVEDGSRQGFFHADGTPITGHVAVGVGDLVRGFFNVDAINGSNPGVAQGVEWTALVSLKIVNAVPNAGGVFITFGADPSFGTSLGLPTNTAVAFYQDASQNHTGLPPDINNYSDGQFFWSLGFVTANNMAVAESFIGQVFGDTGATNAAGSVLAQNNFSFDITAFNPAIGGLSGVVDGLRNRTENQLIANNGAPGPVTGEFVGFSNLSGSQGAAPNTVTANYAIIDNAHIDFAVFAPAPEAFWGGAALLGSIGAVRLIRRRVVAC